MKRKSILIVIGFCLVLQPYVSFGSEVPALGYWQRFKNYVAESCVGWWWAEGERLDPVGRKRLQSVWTGGKKGALIGATVGATVGGLYGLHSSGDAKDLLYYLPFFPVFYVASTLVWSAYNKG